MYVHAGGVGGRNNSRQGLSQLGFNATNTRNSPGNNVPAYYWDNGVPPIAQAPPFIDPSYGTGLHHRQSHRRAEPGLRRPEPRRQAAVLPELELRTSALAQREHDAGRGVQRPAWASSCPAPATAASRVNIAPLKYLALGSLLTATANAANIAPAQAHRSRRSRCRFPTSSEPSARCCAPSRSTAPSQPVVQRGPVQLPGPAGHLQSPVRPRAYLPAGLHVQQATGQSAGHARATPSTIRWKNRAAPSTTPRLHGLLRVPTALRRRAQPGPRQRRSARVGERLDPVRSRLLQLPARRWRWSARPATRAAFWAPAFRATTPRSTETSASTAITATAMSSDHRPPRT